MARMRPAALATLRALLALHFALMVLASSPLAPEDSCGLYLATSTIPNSGLGIFTSGPALSEGDTIEQTDLCIPLIDLRRHNDPKDFYWPFSDYVWQGGAMGMQQDSYSDRDLSAFCPGVNCLVNGHLGLLNVEKIPPEFDSGGLHRSRNPGAGANTPYHKAETPVTKDIPSGGELFKFYGNSWFVTRTHTFGLIPLTKDYSDAEDLVRKFDGLPLPSEQIRQELWKVVTTDVSWESRTMNAIPTEYNHVATTVRDGIRAIHQPGAIRSQEYLRKNGRCMDHIEPRRNSTLPEAGHGAFARHFLPKGTVITASPLLTVVDKAYLNIYEYVDKNGDGKAEYRSKNALSKQILLNYCIGHPESTLLLCPYGAGISYINHNHTQANVKIQWAADGVMSHNASWFDLSVDDMKRKYKPSLAIEYAALRDIQPGEELFLDYGDAWEEAWQQHVRSWRAPLDSKSYAPAEEWNSDMRSAPIRTKQEQLKDPYPKHIIVRCHPALLRENWKPLLNSHPRWLLTQKDVPCHVLSRYVSRQGNITHQLYNVLLREKDSRRMLHRVDIPRSFLRYVDGVQSTDIHLKTAFRHEQHFPDAMFPTKWRNLKNTKSHGVFQDSSRIVSDSVAYDTIEDAVDLGKSRFWILSIAVALACLFLILVGRNRCFRGRSSHRKLT